MYRSLIIAARSEIVVRGLKDLASEVSGLRILATARDAEGAHRAIDAHDPGMVILDVDLVVPLRALMRGHGFNSRVLVLSTTPAPISTGEPWASDTCSSFDQRAPPEQILSHLRIVARCRRHSAGHSHCRGCELRLATGGPALPLSAREREIFVHIGHGWRNKDIAAKLGISVKTVETHREHIKRKLGFDSAFALTNAAVAWNAGRGP